MNAVCVRGNDLLNKEENLLLHRLSAVYLNVTQNTPMIPGAS